MRVFVTGGNGFVGSAVVRALVGAGHTVRCLLRPTSDIDRIRDLAVERVVGDVRQPDALRAGMRDCDGTIHLAAPGGWGGDDPRVLHDVIVNGTQHVLDAAAAIDGHRVVHVSSTAAIAASDQPRVFDETSAFNVREPALRYSHAKHDAELRVRDACARGVPVVVVNPSEVYGPGDTQLVSASSLVDFATATPVLVCRGGTSVVHVDDVAAGTVAALERGRPGERYILGGENLTIRQLAELVLGLIGRNASIVTVPNTLGRLAARAAVAARLPVPFNPHVVEYATRYWFVDNAKARRELGARFRGAEETIRETLDWLRRSGRLS
jgi:dihydroflavonol-4-reductase